MSVKHLNKKDFFQKWRAHFGGDVHPIAQAIVGTSKYLYEKSYEDSQLCWELNQWNSFSFTIALELERTDGKENWHVLLPRYLFAEQDVVAGVWIGREMAAAPYFARELVGNNPFCLLEVTFTSEEMQVEVFFGPAKK